MRMPRFAIRAVIKAMEIWDFYIDTPKFIRGIDPMRASVMVANLGSVGMGAAYHHLFEWGTCSLFVALGQIRPSVCVGEDGAPAVRQQAEIRVAFDERVADGFQDARALARLADHLRDPARLREL